MERPKIADKVRFWEEQDRINKELIPRVLKQHELLAAHVEHADPEARAQVRTMEERIAAQIRTLEENTASRTGTLEESVAAQMRTLEENTASRQGRSKRARSGGPLCQASIAHRLLCKPRRRYRGGRTLPCVGMPMESLSLLPALQALPSIEGAVELSPAEMMPQVRAMDRGNFAVEVSIAVEEGALFDARNVDDQFAEAHSAVFPNAASDYGSMHDHYQEVLGQWGSASRALSAIEGQARRVQSRVRFGGTASGLCFTGLLTHAVGLGSSGKRAGRLRNTNTGQDRRFGLRRQRVGAHGGKP